MCTVCTAHLSTNWPKQREQLGLSNSAVGFKEEILAVNGLKTVHPTDKSALSVFLPVALGFLSRIMTFLNKSVSQRLLETLFVSILLTAIRMIPLHFYCVKAKQRFEREERRNELKRLRGEDTWMLPEVDQRLQEIEEVRFRVVFVITLHYFPCPIPQLM